MKKFLNEVVPAMNQGYRESATGKAKTLPLHAKVNQAIVRELGDDFSVIGYGGYSDSECTIKTQSGQHWKPDGFFCLGSKINNGSNLKGATIDYKAPYSNVFQNIMNTISIFRSEASLVRPDGNLFAGFLIIPETVPYFDRNGVIKNLEHPARKYAKELHKLANSTNSLDSSPDLLCLCVYRMNGLDFSKIFTKDDYTEALTNFSGEIEYVDLNGITSDGRFIFNDPETFVKKYAEMISKQFHGTSKEDRYMTLFAQTPIEEQEKYLIEHNKLMFIPSYIN